MRQRLRVPWRPDAVTAAGRNKEAILPVSLPAAFAFGQILRVGPAVPPDAARRLHAGLPGGITAIGKVAVEDAIGALPVESPAAEQRGRGQRADNGENSHSNNSHSGLPRRLIARASPRRKR